MDWAKEKKRIVIGWWGCLDGGGETLGDLMAVTRFRNFLMSLGHDVVVLSCCDYETSLGDRIVKVPAESLISDEFNLFVFVCGPLILESPALRALLKRFDHIQKIAVCVSVLPGTMREVESLFDLVLCRDGGSENFGDYAFLPMLEPSIALGTGTIGICLRGPQREYGVERCNHEQAARLATSCVNLFGGHALDLSTRLDCRPNSAADIFRAFSSVDLVVSSRLHGCLHALALGKPFFGIDQINSGAKVAEVLQQLKWPHFWICSEANGLNKLRTFLAGCSTYAIIADLRRSQFLMAQSVNRLEREVLSCIA